LADELSPPAASEAPRLGPVTPVLKRYKSLI
jgi:hypothetical protein